MVRVRAPAGRSDAPSHRWGAVCPAAPGVLWALAVRSDADSDAEDDAVADSHLVKLVPGDMEWHGHMPGVAAGLALLSADDVVVLGPSGSVRARGAEVAVSGARALAVWHDAAVVAGDEGLALWTPPSARLTQLAPWRASGLTVVSDRVVAACDDGGLRSTDGARGSSVPVEGLSGSGALTALAGDDTGRLVAASPTMVFSGDVVRGLKPLCAVPWEPHALALHRGRVFVGSRAHGLFVVDEDDGPPRLAPFKPSLCAHTLAVRGTTLAAASDLYVGSMDVDELLTRDLAALVRLVERHPLGR